MPTAALALAPSRRPAGLRTTLHRCLACGRRFPYHYEGAYHPDQLRPVDFVCRRCFSAWFWGWEAAHGWGPAPTPPDDQPAPGPRIVSGGAPV